MYYFLASLLVAIIGVVPLLLRGKIGLAISEAIGGFLVIWLIAYLGCPSTAYPLLGYFGFATFLMWILSAIVDGATTRETRNYYDSGTVTWTAWFPIVTLIVYMGSCVGGSGMLRATEYASMIGPMEERVWTEDVQPKSPEHMRMGNDENATYQAQKTMGSAGAIGSQFAISEDHMTLQMINGSLWFVVPLDYVGFSVWTSTSGVPGYIKISGEDPHRQPELVMLPNDQRMIYTPNAYFGDNLERHLRNTGYLNVGLANCTFEIDESGKPFWVITTFKPTIMWSGEKATGVVVVDPTTGATTFFEMGKVPDWIDRAVPANYIWNYLAWQGEYSYGWVNSWWGGKGLTKPENPMLIYGEDDQPEFVTGITSKSNKDDSLVALIYTNSRTGKSVKYVMKGGATEAAVLDAVNKNQQVQFKHLHGAAVQLYNVNGIATAVVPLLNESHAFQEVAMVSINDIQRVAVGTNQTQALRAYEALISEGGQRIALDKERDIQTIEGVVDRKSAETTPNATIYYVLLRDVPHLFLIEGGTPELIITNPGDKVRMEFYQSARDVVPVKSFTNLDIRLSTSVAQQIVAGTVRTRQNQQEAKEDAQTTLERLKKLSDEELQKLGKQVPIKK